jgi:WS/DGAT/MGAT family acyltransferase
MVTRITKPPVARQSSGTTPAAHEAATQRMSTVDTAWLRMDGASNLMMIVGVWIIQPGVTFDAVAQRIQARLLQYPRFGQRVQQDATGAHWVTDPDFKIERHVVRETLPTHAPGQAQQVLQQRLGELAMQPLDMNHPLWQFGLVEHYEGGSALLARIHHCIADGLALIAVTQTMVDGGAEPPQPPPKAPTHDGIEGLEDWLIDNVLKPVTQFTAKALNNGLDAPADLARLAYQVLRDGAALALMPDDSPTRLKGTPGLAKRVAWCQPLPLDEVRAVGKALNCSINDVLLSCVAGAIGGYLKSLGDDVAGQEIRAMVPVNLRPMEEAYKLGNKFGLAPVVLPIGLDNPIERVYEVRRRMTELKGSLQPLLAFGMLAVAGFLTKPAQDALLNLFSRKTTAVMTNVPGPREKLKFCGSTLEQSLFWVPQSGTVGLGVSILSYGGSVQFGVIGDIELCPDPQKIIDQFEPEFAKLTLLTLMLPWGE